MSRDWLARVMPAIPVSPRTLTHQAYSNSPWKELAYWELGGQAELSPKLGPSSLKSELSNPI